MQAAGLIQYSLGYMVVINRPGLEARVCECYWAVKLEYERLFAMTAASLARHRVRPNPSTLRQRAEARLRQAQAAAPDAAPPTPWDTAHLVHELQVHQIELEMHNEELQHAYQEADALREKYADIYDFAPVAYFNLDYEKALALDLTILPWLEEWYYSNVSDEHMIAMTVAAINALACDAE